MRVVVMAGGRSDYLQQTLRSWAMVDGIEEVEFVISCNPDADPGVVLHTGPQHARIVMHEWWSELRHPWEAREDGFVNGHDVVVCADDDIVVAPDVLRFFQYTYDHFAFAPPFLAACAYHNYDGGVEDGIGHRIDLRSDFTTGVSMVVYDKWVKYLRDDWDFDYRRRGFDWVIRDQIVPENGLMCAFPAISRGQHIGRIGAHVVDDAMFKDHLAKPFANDVDLGTEDWWVRD